MNKEFLVEKIRAEYTEKEFTELDALRALDRKVRRPAGVLAYILGTVGALVMGAGMSFCMDAVEAGTYFGITIGENMMLPGVILGVAGMALVLINYPVYKRFLASRRKKYASQINELCDDLTKE